MSERKPQPIYTRKGDDGTTGLYFGGRVSKDSVRPAAYGDVDELQSIMGLARSHPHDDQRLDEIVISLQRDLWVVMADLATGADNRNKLTEGSTKVTTAMVERLETLIDEVSTWFTPPTEFVEPGGRTDASVRCPDEPGSSDVVEPDRETGAGLSGAVLQELRFASRERGVTEWRSHGVLGTCS